MRSSRRSAFANNALPRSARRSWSGSRSPATTSTRASVPSRRSSAPPLAEAVARPFNKNNTPVELHVEVVRNASARMRLHVVLRVAITGGAEMTRLSDD